MSTLVALIYHCLACRNLNWTLIIQTNTRIWWKWPWNKDRWSLTVLSRTPSWYPLPGRGGGRTRDLGGFIYFIFLRPLGYYCTPPTFREFKLTVKTLPWRIAREPNIDRQLSLPHWTQRWYVSVISFAFRFKINSAKPIPRSTSA